MTTFIAIKNNCYLQNHVLRLSLKFKLFMSAILEKQFSISSTNIVTIVLKRFTLLVITHIIYSFLQKLSKTLNSEIVSPNHPQEPISTVQINVNQVILQVTAVINTASIFNTQDIVLSNLKM